MSYISPTDVQSYIDSAELTALFTDSGTYSATAFNQLCEAATDAIVVALRNAGYTPPSTIKAGLGNVTLNTAGSSYTNGDVLTLVQSGASGGTVTATVSGGAVTSGTITTAGLGYSVASGVATTGGTGTGCKFNITLVTAAVSEFIKLACIGMFRELASSRKFLKLPEDWRDSPMYLAKKEILAAEAELNLPYSTADTEGGVIGPIIDTSDKNARPKIFGRRNLAGL